MTLLSISGEIIWIPIVLGILGIVLLIRGIYVWQSGSVRDTRGPGGTGSYHGDPSSKRVNPFTISSFTSGLVLMVISIVVFLVMNSEK